MGKYIVELGEPEVEQLYNDLLIKVDNETATSEELKFFLKIDKALNYLETGQYPSGFKSKHKEQIDSLTKKN